MCLNLATSHAAYVEGGCCAPQCKLIGIAHVLRVLFVSGYPLCIADCIYSKSKPISCVHSTIDTWVAVAYIHMIMGLVENNELVLYVLEVRGGKSALGLCWKG